MAPVRSAAVAALLWGALSAAAPAKKAAPPPDAGLPATGNTAPQLPAISPGGESGAKKDVAPSEAAKPRLFEGLGKNPQEEAQLEELSHIIEEYEAESKDFRHEVQLLIEKKYEEKRSLLANSYEKAIRDLEVLERK